MGRRGPNFDRELEVWAMWCSMKGVPKNMDEAERQMLEQAAVFAAGNQSLMARVLNISRPKLLRDLKRLGMAILLLILPGSIIDAGAVDTLVADSTNKIPILVPGEGVTEAIGRWLYQRDGCLDTGIVYLTLNVQQNAWIDSVDALLSCRRRHSDCIDTLGFYRGNSQLAWQTAEREELLIDTLRALVSSLNGQVLAHRITVETQAVLLDSLNRALSGCNLVNQLLADSLVWFRKEKTRMQKLINSQALMIGPLMSAKVILEAKLQECMAR